MPPGGPFGPWTGAVPPAEQPTPGRRGHYTIYLGMAAGVGKTYRMLQEGHAEIEAGRDVVIGLLETHGRQETQALAEGLPLVPRRRVTYRDTDLEDMDLPAILRRRPEVCLVDELAHTNAPGLEHEKRYEDIEDLLDAGIDVISTLNVQHLESLNDQVAELSGARVRETMPDSVLGRADEVVLIDLSPEALLARLRAGKVYKPERIDAALNGFFRIENLSALREVALRQVAEEVEAKRLITERVGTREDTVAADMHMAVGERLLALVEPSPGTQRLVRRAWRSSQRLGAQLDLLWVAPPGHGVGGDDIEQERQLTALRQLASVLGSTLIVEEGDDVADTVAAVARERGTTYILMGRSRPARGPARLRVPLPQRLMEALPGVDVRIVADRSLRNDIQRRDAAGPRHDAGPDAPRR
jgi:two-component system, OmpR family, sensor histidine kinase KdpD